MDREQLEFRISQYVDGTLSAADVAALEATLASDAEARALLEDFRKIDGTFKSTPLPLPAVNWERLAESISAAIAEEDRATTSIPIRAWRVRRVAIAAAVLIAVGTVVLWPRRTGHEQLATIPHEVPTAVVQVGRPEVAGQPAVG